MLFFYCDQILLLQTDASVLKIRTFHSIITTCIHDIHCIFYLAQLLTLNANSRDETPLGIQMTNWQWNQ